MPDRVHPLADATARSGGKAAHLARLIRAGLPVPDGFVLDHDAFVAVVGPPAAVPLDEVGGALAAAEDAARTAPLPPALEDDVRARAAALGRLAVRSSMSLEDAGAGAAAAGVFASLVDVPPAEVWDAIRSVWASAFTPLAAAYARRRGQRARVGVIVQRFVPGRRITVYTRAPGAPASGDAWVEPAGEAAVAVRRGAGDPRVVLAIAAEQAIEAAAGADVELIEGPGGLAVVQARPIVHPAPRPRRMPPPPALLAATRAAPGVTWRWDAAHNPAPLSVAQAALVECVDAARAAPHRMRVIAGHLYVAASADAPAPLPAPPPARTAAALTAAVRDALARAAAALDAAGDAPAVDAALAAYVAFYRIWAGEAAPTIAATRRWLEAEAARTLGGDRALAARALAAAATGAEAPIPRALARLRAGGDPAEVRRELGALAPAWDVAAPTLAEEPGWLDATTAARPAAPPAAGAPAAALPPPLADLARAAAGLAEEDDLAFARAQALVRGALLRAAARHRLVDAADAFWLPPVELAGDAIDPLAAHARAAAARAAAARAAAWDMPLAIADGAAVDAPAAGDHAGPLRGVGHGPRVAGRVAVIADLAAPAPVPPGTVVVVAAVTPSLALFVQGAAALVSEHGGALDHGAALARELGIPYVTGCRGATQVLAPGDRVIVDGDAGTLTRLA